MEDSPRYVTLQSGLYTQIALYAAGNALSLAVFLMVYHMSAVLADFRDPMLYALLSSIALRGPKDWLVQRVEVHLAQQRSLILSLLTACAPPYVAAQWAWREGIEAADAFSGKDAWRIGHIRLNDKNATETAHSPTKSTAGSPRPHEELPMPPRPLALAVYARAGLRTLTSRKQRQRSNRRRRTASAIRKPSSTSNRMLLWLFVVCLSWAGYEWVRDTWSRTAHVVLVTASILAAACLLFWSIFNAFNIWQPLVARLAGSPAKTPTTNACHVKSPPKPVPHTVSPARSKRPRMFIEVGEARGTMAQLSQPLLRPAGGALGDAFAAVGGIVRKLLQRNVHALVSLSLIAALLVGTAGAGAFITVQVANEARGAVAAARDAFPTGWSGIATGSPLDGVNTSNVAGSAPRRLQQVASVQLPPWLEAYQRDALTLAQRSLPGVVSWLDAQLHGVMQAHNLTDALWDARLMYEAAQGPRECGERERIELLVAMSKSEVAWQEANEEEVIARSSADAAVRALSEVVAALDGLLSSSGRGEGRCDTSGGALGECSADSTNEGGKNAYLELQRQVVAADAAVDAAKAKHKAAAYRLDNAVRVRKVADGRLQLCSSGNVQNGMGNTHASISGNASSLGPFAELNSRLESAYTKLFWQWRFREGLAELRGAASHAARSLTLRDRGSPADLSRLHRLVQAAAVPLIVLGRTAAASVGATTAAALMGSLGLFRLGLGVFHLGVQAALFVTLLYYLLAARTDPLARAVALLPLPNAARHRAAGAINAALGGVFMSLLKLAALHGMFTWVTYRALGVPLAYTSSAASAAFALLPFVPTYVVALPGCATVALQGRVATAAVLLALHFAAYYIGDSMILEDAGGHPFMTSLAILGGLWAFSNPLLGCLLGPILLSLLSAMGTLHTELMGGASFLPTPGRECATPAPGAVSQLQQQGGPRAGGGSVRVPSCSPPPRGRGLSEISPSVVQESPKRNNISKLAAGSLIGDAGGEGNEGSGDSLSLSLNGVQSPSLAGQFLDGDEEVDSFTFPRRRGSTRM